MVHADVAAPKKLSRRDFLLRGGQSALVMGLASVLPGCGSSASLARMANADVRVLLPMMQLVMLDTRLFARAQQIIPTVTVPGLPVAE